eukprot:4131561-Pleurochrysis_carterae.AAC.1
MCVRASGMGGCGMWVRCAGGRPEWAGAECGKAATRRSPFSCVALSTLERRAYSAATRACMSRFMYVSSGQEGDDDARRHVRSWSKVRPALVTASVANESLARRFSGRAPAFGSAL